MYFLLRDSQRTFLFCLLFIFLLFSSSTRTTSHDPCYHLFLTGSHQLYVYTLMYQGWEQSEQNSLNIIPEVVMVVRYEAFLPHSFMGSVCSEMPPGVKEHMKEEALDSPQPWLDYKCLMKITNWMNEWRKEGINEWIKDPWVSTI